jgi:rhamnosyltransferase
MPSLTLINDLIDGYYNKKSSYNVAAVGPRLMDSRYNFDYSFIRLTRMGFRKKITPHVNDHNPIEVSCLIASGMLIINSSLEKIGLMDEKLFIDYVDTEWCLRSKSLGYSFFMIPDAKLEHEIGDTNIKFFCYRVPVHSPWRRYYRVRNGFLLLQMKHVPKLLSLREISFSVIHQLILLLRTMDVDYLKYYLKSIKDIFRKS